MQIQRAVSVAWLLALAGCGHDGDDGPLQGLTVQPAGAFNAACSIARPLACCD